MQRSCPHVFLSPNVTKNYSSYTPMWTVAFSRYKDPVSAYTPSGINANEQEKLVIVENDAVSVSVSNSKSSFGKIASISLKITNVNYPVLINNGDWCFIWINDNQQDAETIAIELGKVRDDPGYSPKGKLNNYNSGLKFIGRVTSTSLSDSMSGGVRTVVCSIQAQAFLEMASSLYYLFPPDEPLKAGQVEKTGSTVNPNLVNQANFKSLIGSIVDSNISTLASRIYEILSEADTQKRTPDLVIGLLFLTSLGVSSLSGADQIYGYNSTISKAIVPTKHVFQILNIKPGKIWDMYQVYLGLQNYGSKKPEWFNNFAPDINDQDLKNLNDPKVNSSFFHLTSTRCKGFVQFISPQWDNKAVWSTLSDYLNPVSNEMYTALKLDHTGTIRPQLIVREIPFSTGNWKKITEDNKMKVEGVAQTQPETKSQVFTYDQQPQNSQKSLLDQAGSALSAAKSISATAQSLSGGAKLLSNRNSPSGALADARTYYGNLPRWIVDESLITDFTWHTDEAERINFVQITGTAGSLDFMGEKLINDPQTRARTQIQQGNFVVDELDIERHGTRAFVMTTPFDMFPDNQTTSSFSPIWAKMQADWKFNGHLKAKGELTTIGASLPVAEGDNLEVRGLLFHIESINHSASIGKNGTKQFRTTYGLSHGVIAASLGNVQASPHYVSLDAIGIYAVNTPGPGLTEVQNRLTGKAVSPTDKRTSLSSYLGGK